MSDPTNPQFGTTVTGGLTVYDMLLPDKAGRTLDPNTTDYRIFEGRAILSPKQVEALTTAESIQWMSHQMVVVQILWSWIIIFEALYNDHKVAVTGLADHARELKERAKRPTANPANTARFGADYVMSLKKHVTQTRAEMIFTLLEDPITHAIVSFEGERKDGVSLLDPEKGIIKKISSNLLKGILPTESDFMEIPDFMLLRRFMYVWCLVFFLCPRREQEKAEERFVSSFAGVEDL